ncbi:hypothetical protein Tco_0408427 [Tanacetum coccineum]
MSTQQDINAFRTQRLANTHDPLALMANTQTPFHPDQSSHITYIQHPQPNNHFVQQPSFNTNYKQQPMQNPKDSSDPTTAMNTTLALLAKAFKVNTIPTNNNQRSSLIPRNSQIAQPGMNTSQDIKMQMVDDNVGNQVRHNAVQNDGNKVGQNAVQNPSIQIIKNMKGLNVVLEIANQYGNGNVKTAPAEGNGNDINEKEAGIQSTQEEFDFMAVADAYEETERVKVNCTSEDTLQQASTSGTQSDNAPVYDLNGSTKVPSFLPTDDQLERLNKAMALFRSAITSRYPLATIQEGKVDMGKALDASLVVIESSETELEKQDTSSRSGNDADADNAYIRPIYDEEPMAEVQLTAECNIFAT